MAIILLFSLVACDKDNDNNTTKRKPKSSKPSSSSSQSTVTSKPGQSNIPENPNGISDSNPPELISFAFIENGQSFGVGDTVHIKMKVADDTAIDFGRTYPVVNNGDHYIWFDLSYNSTTGFIEGSYTFKATDILGTYSLQYIPCYDIYGNYHHGTLDDNHYIIFS